MNMRSHLGTRKPWTFFVTALCVVALSVLLVSNGLTKEVQASEKQISAADAKAKLDAGEPIVFLDVREPKEFNAGHIPKSVNVPEEYCELEVPLAIPDPKSIVIIYSDGEEKSMNALKILQLTGYKNAVVLAGGLAAWQKAGYPIQK